ncbi:hypothetical protein [Streptomyces sp. TS71-3]|uniref:hypothetical protein n=1 Tax=Streptomyces sp. TS71-3 TaxID=2733862 RepID=UPI002016B222|nr:hypothetical protein [Streptomyces sp. TS71-3]
MRPVREFLADTLLATPDVTRHADIKRLWAAVLGITTGIYVVFVTAGGITVMGYETVQTRYALRQIAPRLLLGMAAAASSLTVMRQAIGLSNALAHAIMATGMSDAGQGMVERVLPFALFGVPGLKLYVLLLAILMIALVLAVLIGFLVRIAVMALLAVGAPLMLACHAHPLTDPVARLWWRGLAGCLVIQVAQSMTFVLALKLFFAPGATTLGIPKSDQLGTVLAGVALFWVLFKIPGWTLQVILRGTPVHNPHAPTGVRILKHLALYRLMDHYLPGMRLLRGRGGPAGGAGFGSSLRGGLGGGGGAPRGPTGGRPGSGGGNRPRPGGSGGGGGRPGPGPGPGHGWPGGAGGRRPESSGGGPRRGRPLAGGPGPGGGRGRGAAGQRTSGAAAGSGTHRSATARTQAVPASSATPGAASRPGHTSQSRSPGSAHVVGTSIGPSAGPPAAQPRGARRPTLSSAAQPVPTRAASAPRARQLALPVPAARVRVRPPRPVQLRLPLEPPRKGNRS